MLYDMDALTLWQPFASVIDGVHKLEETRSWAPPMRVIGKRFAIHAGKRFEGWVNLTPELQEWVRQRLPEKCGLFFQHCSHRKRPQQCMEEALPKGAVVSTALLADVLQVMPWKRHEPVKGMVEVRSAFGDDGPSIRKENLFGDFSVGRFLWVLYDVRELDPPIPAQGHQGLWKWSSDVHQ